MWFRLFCVNQIMLIKPLMYFIDNLTQLLINLIYVLVYLLINTFIN